MYPDRLAVKDENGSITYDELDAAANRVARAILERRGEAQEPVALLYGHGHGFIASILGVLKTGKFYVPVDTSYPPSVIRHILDDSQAALLLSDCLNVSLAREVAEDRCIVLNTDTLDATCPSDGPRYFDLAGCIRARHSHFRFNGSFQRRHSEP